jgi:hypothetical protein
MKTRQATAESHPPNPLRAARPLERQATAHQLRALRVLGVSERSVRRAAFGLDLFAYVEDKHSTLRLQIGPGGGVVGQTVLTRGPGKPNDRRSDGSRNRTEAHC